MISRRRCPRCHKIRDVILDVVDREYICKHCGHKHQEIKHSLNKLLI
jgi:transposase